MSKKRTSYTQAHMGRTWARHEVHKSHARAGNRVVVVYFWGEGLQVLVCGGGFLWLHPPGCCGWFASGAHQGTVRRAGSKEEQAEADHGPMRQAWGEHGARVGVVMGLVLWPSHGGRAKLGCTRQAAQQVRRARGGHVACGGHAVGMSCAWGCAWDGDGAREAWPCGSRGARVGWARSAHGGSRRAWDSQPCRKASRRPARGRWAGMGARDAGWAPACTRQSGRHEGSMGQ